MEIKAELNKPYTDKQRADFIVENNHNLGYEIQETEDALLAVYNEPTVEELQAEVRAVRNGYLEKYVDPKQLVMVWDSLTAEEQELYKDYRQYLLDYTEVEGWYLQNPMTLDEWKETNSSESKEVIEDGLQR